VRVSFFDLSGPLYVITDLVCVTQDKVFADFRQFCSNSEGRLKDYWIELKAMSLKNRRNTVGREGSEDRGLIMEVDPGLPSTQES